MNFAGIFAAAFIIFSSCFTVQAGGGGGGFLAGLSASASTPSTDPRLLILTQEVVNELQRLGETFQRLLLALAHRGHDNGFNPALAAIVAALASRRDDHDERPSIIKIPGNSYANSYGSGGYGRAFEN